ncbi:MAG: acyl--CoA ligase [Afipia sp.]|nr:acyl--CoA ligase [Afipia sp.]
MNIVDPILFHGRYQPAIPALLVPGAANEVVTYHQFSRIIHNIAKRGFDAGLASGNIVALLVQDQLLHVALIFGLAKYGIITVTPNDLRTPSGLRIDAVISDRPVGEAGGRKVLLVDPSWLQGSGEPVKAAAIANEDQSFCRLVLTSGTTGESKAAAFAHGRMSVRAMRHQTVFGHRYAACSRVMLDTGWATAMAFTTAVYVLSRGGTLALRGRTAADTLRVLTNYQVQALVGSPGSLAELINLSDRTLLALPHFDAIISIGSILTPALGERVRSQLGTNLISAYGSTEAGVVASAPAAAIAHIPGAVGFVTPDVAVDIVDDKGKALAPGEIGRIRIRSGASPVGLIDQSGRLVPFDDGGHYSGDLGSFTPDGVLIIAGREKEIINLGGSKISPESIELALTKFAPVRDAGVFALPSAMGIEQIVGVIVWHDNADRDASRQELRRHLEHHLTVSQIPKLFVELESIPRGTMGKIDRAALAKAASDALKNTKAPIAQKSSSGRRA